MRIIAVADLHGNLPEDVPECDLLIIAGDICPHFGKIADMPGSVRDVEGQASWLLTAFKPWLESQPAKQILGCWGNHDFVGQYTVQFADIFRELPWILLEDEETVYPNAYQSEEGLCIYGTPYTRRYGSWAFMEEEGELAKRFARIPEDLDILISHGPPMWACDRAAGDNGDRLGSEALYDRIRTMQKPPKHLICGHIHGGKGWGTVFGEYGSTQVWNVASVDEAYQLHTPSWTEITLDGKAKSKPALEMSTVSDVGAVSDQQSMSVVLGDETK